MIFVYAPACAATKADADARQATEVARQADAAEAAADAAAVVELKARSHARGAAPCCVLLFRRCSTFQRARLRC